MTDRTALLEKDGTPTLEELKEHFRNHDFSAQVSGYDFEHASSEQNKLYIRTKRIFLKAWEKQLKILGNRGSMLNFTEFSPIGCLESAEEKLVADELSISILLVHHLRKQGDSDPLNKLSGTTGISGAMDAIFVLDKSKRNADMATLICTGRDIEYREMEMRLSKENCAWNLVSDSLENPQMILPDEMVSLVEFMKVQKSFSGTNSEFIELFNSYYDKKLSAKSLKQMMNRWRYSLEEYGVQFINHRSNGQRLVDISYSSVRDESAVSDESTFGDESCVPSVPCAPVNEREPISARFTDETKKYPTER